MKPLIVGLLMSLCMMPAWAAELPGDSIYRLELPLQTDDGTSIMLPSLRGKALLVTLFYSQCSSVCPMVTARLQGIERNLPPEARRNVNILMVSLDSQHDSPQALRTFRREHHIEADPRWIVARTSADDVRILAAVLGVRYRDLPDGGFNHSASIALVDAEGVIRARAEGVSGGEPDFVRQVQSIAAAARTTRGDREPTRFR
jgi:protein SCO1